MNQLVYSYVVLIENNSSFLNNEHIKKNFENISEMSLSSRDYDTYQQCEDSLMSILGFLAEIEARDTQEEHVIVTINKSDLEDASSWSEMTISKKMIVKSKSLDDAVIDCSVIGLITSNKHTFSVN